MNIVITGSLGNIGRPLSRQLVAAGHRLTVITRTQDRKPEIESLGAVAAVGSMQDVHFLTETFRGADAVYLMESWEGIGSIFDRNIDFVAAFKEIGRNYFAAIRDSGVKRVVHLSSIGAHTASGTGSLAVHHAVEEILKGLPADVSIKFLRPVGFYTNLFRQLHTIRERGVIAQGYGGDRKEPWVSPQDIASAIAEAMESPFDGRSVRYLASDEVSPDEIAAVLGKAIGNPGLRWDVVPADQLLEGMLAAGMNDWIANGFVAMQTAQGDGSLYEDYYRNRPELGQEKFADFATAFAAAYHQQ